MIGPSGKLLRALLDDAELRTGCRPSIFITNVVGCRPPENRNPRKEEIEACRPRVEGIAEACQPKVVLLLGTVAKLNWKAKGPWKVVHAVHPALVHRKGGDASYEYLHLLRIVQDIYVEVCRC